MEGHGIFQNVEGLDGILKSKGLFFYPLFRPCAIASRRDFFRANRIVGRIEDRRTSIF